MEASAKHDFNATADDELSFRKGQVLKVSIDSKPNNRNSIGVNHKMVIKDGYVAYLFWSHCQSIFKDIGHLFLPFLLLIKNT